MNKNNQTSNANDRQKERDCIAQQIEDFLKSGGKIEVLQTPFDKADPKCKVGHEASFFN